MNRDRRRKPWLASRCRSNILSRTEAVHCQRIDTDDQAFAMNAVRLALALTVLSLAKSTQGGTGRQTTTFLVNADEQVVCRWIEQNSTAIDESTGAEVLVAQGRESKLRKETKEGTLNFVVRHDTEQHGEYRTVLLKSDKADLVAQETEIQVEREGDGSRITIRVVATVSDHSAMAISIGIRPSLRGMRKLLEGHFGSPNGP
jgi:hypothetical protein